MLEKWNISRDAETDRCIQLTHGFLLLAEKELSAFIGAVDKLFGAEQARQSALDRIEELLRERATPKAVVRKKKPTFARPAPDPLREEIVGGTDVLIEALAD